MLVSEEVDSVEVAVENGMEEPDRTPEFIAVTRAGRVNDFAARPFVNITAVATFLEAVPREENEPLGPSMVEQLNSQEGVEALKLSEASALRHRCEVREVACRFTIFVEAFARAFDIVGRLVCHWRTRIQ